MGYKHPAGGDIRPARRWGSLAFVLALAFGFALVLGLIGLATRAEALPVDPAALDGIEAPPVLGHTFYGTVKNSQGTSLPNGTTVMAKAASGAWTGSVSTKVGPPDANSGYFVVTVPADDPDTGAVDGATAGTPIIFYVAGVKAKIYDVAQAKFVDSYPWKSGDSTNLNLQADVNYTITASAGAGGTIDPSGSVSVPLGGSRTFTISANDSYAIADVVVDGTSKGAVSTYTFSNVTSNHAIAASFARTTGDLAGYVFLDGNGNGVRDAGEEAGLVGVTITLLLPGGGTQTTLTTGAEGGYLFGGLAPGQYTVQQTQPPGYASTSPDSVSVAITAGSQAQVNFGERAWTPTPSPTSTGTPTGTPTSTPTVTPTATATPTAEPSKQIRVYLPIVILPPAQ